MWQKDRHDSPSIRSLYVSLGRRQRNELQLTTTRFGYPCYTKTLFALHRVHQSNWRRGAQAGAIWAPGNTVYSALYGPKSWTCKGEVGNNRTWRHSIVWLTNLCAVITGRCWTDRNRTTFTDCFAYVIRRSTDSGQFVSARRGNLGPAVANHGWRESNVLSKLALQNTQHAFR
jgi:hypothetical protein